MASSLRYRDILPLFRTDGEFNDKLVKFLLSAMISKECSVLEVEKFASDSSDITFYPATSLKTKLCFMLKLNKDCQLLVLCDLDNCKIHIYDPVQAPRLPSVTKALENAGNQLLKLSILSPNKFQIIDATTTSKQAYDRKVVLLFHAENALDEHGNVNLSLPEFDSSALRAQYRNYVKSENPSAFKEAEDFVNMEKKLRESNAGSLVSKQNWTERVQSRLFEVYNEGLWIFTNYAINSALEIAKIKIPQPNLLELADAIVFVREHIRQHHLPDYKLNGSMSLLHENKIEKLLGQDPTVLDDAKLILDRVESFLKDNDVKNVSLIAVSSHWKKHANAHWSLEKYVSTWLISPRIRGTTISYQSNFTVGSYFAAVKNEDMKSLYNKHQKDHLSLCRKCFIIWEELMNVALIKMLTLEKMLASAQFSNTEVHVTCFQTTAHDGFGKFILTLKSRIFSLECCKEDLINFRSVDSKVKDELRDLAIEKPFVKALPYLQYGPFVVVLTNGAPQLLDRHTINVSRAVFGISASGSLTFLGRLFDSNVRHFTIRHSDELDSMREMFPEEVALYGLETVTITNDLLKQHKDLWKSMGLDDISNKLEENRLVFGSRFACIVGSSNAALDNPHEKALHKAFNLKNSERRKWESWLKVRSSEWDQLHFSAYDAQNFELKFLISSCCKDLGPSKWIVQNRIGFCKCTNCRNDRTIENAAGLFCCQRLFDDDVDSERSRHLKKHFPNDLKCLAEHYFEAERVLPQPKRLRKRYELQRMKIYFNDINDFLYNGVKGNKSTLDKHLPLCFLAKVREKVNVESRAEAIEEHFWPVSPRPYDSQQFWRRKLVSIQAATKEKKFNVFRHPIESEFYKNQNGDLYKAISFAIFDNYVTHFAEKLKGKVDEIIADDSSLTPLDVIPSILTLRLIVHRCVDPDHETYEWARYPGTVDKKTQKYPSVLLKEDKTAYYAIENLIDTVDV